MKLFLASLLLIPSLLFAASEPIEKHPEWDQEYSKKIRENTTAPEFLTDLVDHLPASDKVPTPLKFNGYIAGAADRLTYAEDVHKYMRALEAASPRIKVFSIGKSEEGREMILVVIADENTIQNLNRYKEITGKLADPRKLSDSDAVALIKEGKPMYYLTGAMHSPETGSPEMLMELAYRLVVDDSSMYQSIRQNMITLITPVLETDGRNRMVDTVRWYQANNKSVLPPLIYWGHYVAHDNNRDTMGLTLDLTRNVLTQYYEWHPQVIHDLHESIPFLYVSTGTGPYNAWLDPIAINEWQRMAYHEVQALTEKGLPGVWTHGFYDGWAPNYMFWVAHGHNSIGRFYETFGNLIPSTENRKITRDFDQRAWYRPNPPYPQVKWSLRNNTNYMESGTLLALKYMAENREHFLNLYWTLGKRSVAKATTEGPAAYVFPADQKRKGQLRELLQLLQLHGIEIQQADQAFSVKVVWPPKKKEDPADKKPEDTSKEKPKDAKAEKPQEDIMKFPAGSYVVRLDQPYSRLADALLDTQYVRGEERVYDDTGWTLGYVKNVDFKRVVNTDVLKVSMHPWDGKIPAAGSGSNTSVVAIRNYADTDLIRLRYALPDAKFTVTEEEYKQKGSVWPVGTVLITTDENDSRKVQDALSNTSLSFASLASLPSIRAHQMSMPRIAILHTWIDTQDEGWFRLALDNLKVPYDYISTQDVSVLPDLKSKYDVIIFPPTDAEPHDIVNGLPDGPPIPWKKTPLTPNLGVDETDNMRPGLGMNGVLSLKKFVEDGGLLITVRETAIWAVEYGLARWVSIVKTQNLKARGAILQASVIDDKSPLSFGYDKTVPVHFANFPVFRVGVFPPDDRKESRPSGRGSKTDPDVPQGRPFVEEPEKIKPAPGEEGFQLPDDLGVYYEPYIPKPEERPRVILSFSKEPDQVLLSGMLEGADEIAGKPAVIDSPLGKGHILLFANNPMWRMNTQGNFALVFNAIFNYQNLNLGWPPVPEKKATK